MPYKFFGDIYLFHKYIMEMHGYMKHKFNDI